MINHVKTTGLKSLRHDIHVLGCPNELEDFQPYLCALRSGFRLVGERPRHADGPAVGRLRGAPAFPVTTERSSVQNGERRQSDKFTRAYFESDHVVSDLQ